MTVTLHAGDDVAGAVNANPAGTAFLLSNGTYSGQTITPKNGNTFIGESRAGVILTGNDVTAECFRGTATDVTIQNLTVEHYLTGTAPNGAIDPDPSGGAARWVVDNCEVRYNGPGAGVKLARNSTIKNSYIHHNGKVGITAFQVSDCTVQDTEWAWNNWDPAHPNSTTGLFDYLNDAGGSKFVGTTNLIVQRNNVHDNIGIGVWCDIDAVNTVIDSNNVHDNAAAGILYEISWTARISNNTVTNNGLRGTRHGPGIYGGGITATESKNVEAYGNTVSGNQAGIMGQQTARGSGLFGTYTMDGFYVHDNNITSSDWTAGLVQFIGDNTYFTSRGVSFQRNIYHGPGAWRWNNSVVTFAQWQAFGLDVTASDPPKELHMDTSSVSSPMNTVWCIRESTVALGGAGTKNGATRVIGDSSSGGRGWSKFRAFVNADQAGTLNMQQSADGTNWFTTISQAVSASSPTVVESIVALPFVRAQYVNGATPQGSFEFDTSLVAI